VIVFLVLLYSCGDDNTQNNNNVTTSVFAGNWQAIISNLSSNDQDTVNINVSNAGFVNYFSVQILDNDSLLMSASVSGPVTNDTVFNFTAIINYQNLVFTNHISGSSTDSACQASNCVKGTVKLLGSTIGTFYGEVFNNTVYIGTTIPNFNMSIRLRKILPFNKPKF
jgi:hypothetical protein